MSNLKVLRGGAKASAPTKDQFLIVFARGKGHGKAWSAIIEVDGDEDHAAEAFRVWYEWRYSESEYVLHRITRLPTIVYVELQLNSWRIMDDITDEEEDA